MSANGEVDFDGDNLTESFQYLDVLRESGVTNMYGAGPYLAEEFTPDGRKASRIVQASMETFSHEVSAADWAKKFHESSKAACPPTL